MVDNKIKTAKVLGINIDLLDFQECLTSLISRIKEKQGAHVITINPEMFQTAAKNKEFEKIVSNAQFIVPDGVGVKIALKLKGINQQTIPGIELAEALIEYCSKNNLNVALIGTKEDVLDDAVKNLTEKYTGLKIVYSRNGFFSTEEEDKIIKDLSASKPVLILAALGSPKQEFFINKCREELKEGLFIGVGGSFDVWAGRVNRAPSIYRKLGLEWLYRTITEPKRFKRIFPTLPFFLFKVIIDAYKK